MLGCTAVCATAAGVGDLGPQANRREGSRPQFIFLVLEFYTEHRVSLVLLSVSLLRPAPCRRRLRPSGINKTKNITIAQGFLKKILNTKLKSQITLKIVALSGQGFRR